MAKKRSRKDVAVINPDFSWVSAKDGKTYSMTPKEKAFADKYLDLFGNGTRAIMGVYTNVKNPKVAAAMAYEYLRKPHIYEYVNSKLEEAGFNDDNVTKQHLFVINQQADLPSKTRAIELFYKLKGKLKDAGGGNKTLVVVISGESAQRYGVRTS